LEVLVHRLHFSLSMKFDKTVAHVDIKKFMKSWYVIAGRLTPFENDAHSAIEKYTYNEEENRIDVDFTFHKKSFNGPFKSFPQKAWVVDEKTNAHWKVQPVWPLKFDYLVIALDEHYKWTAIGVPSGRYLWIMSSAPTLSAIQLKQILSQIESIGYPVDSIVKVPQIAKKLVSESQPYQPSSNERSPDL
jgi:apolipoprotein D and lipocalin family protein